MKTVIVILLLAFAGCRMACYTAWGTQSVDKVEVRLVNVKPDPNMAEIVGAVIKAMGLK